MAKPNTDEPIHPLADPSPAEQLYSGTAAPQARSFDRPPRPHHVVQVARRESSLGVPILAESEYDEPGGAKFGSHVRGVRVKKQVRLVTGLARFLRGRVEPDEALELARDAIRARMSKRERRASSRS